MQSVRERPPHVPLVWSHGMGVDSTAAACLLVEHGVRPDAVLFADTGGEKPGTYEYVPIMNEFLRKHGCPEVTVVRRRHKQPDLETACLNYDSMPGLACGTKSCSMAWKIEPMNQHTEALPAAVECWTRGDRVVKLIGLDYGERDSARFAEANKKRDAHYDYWHPLREFKLDREACKSVIRNAGLPVPTKSACFFCPATKKEELRDLYRDHPELAHRAMLMEVNALQGKHGLDSTVGLGRCFSWVEYLCQVSPTIDAKYGEWAKVIRDHRGRRYHYDSKGRMLAAVWAGVVRWARPGFVPKVKYKPRRRKALV